jgi:hypothetical protein
MYLIDKDKNKISDIDKKKFSELGFKERENLQEWLANKPDCLGEELLIIQKEFDGFDDTNERLDLLALDKDGNLVIIENKLDDTGKDVVWQSLKYASYCSTFTKANIIETYQKFLTKKGKNENAKENLTEFFKVTDLEEIELNQKQSQKIFLVAANFRKEVTSTVLWLREYNVQISCFKATPYQMEENLLLDIRKIIPLEDAEEYIIKLAEKNQESIIDREKSRGRTKVNQDFWAMFIEESNKKNGLFHNRSPSKESWMSKSGGLSGVGYGVVISRTFARTELYIDTGEKEENKKLFNYLEGEKEEIEKEIGYKLTWERLDEKRASRIKYELEGVNIDIEEDWNKMIDFLIENSEKFEKVFSKRISALKKIIK